VRIFRVFRLTKHFQAMQVITHSLKGLYKEVILLLILILSASLFYGTLLIFAEKAAQQLHIYDTVWFALVSMTTVGYGDIYPVTILGKVVAVMCTISGILIMFLLIPAIVKKVSRSYDIYHACQHLANQQKQKQSNILGTNLQEVHYKNTEVVECKI
jgi:hypothetical protein